MNNFKHLKSRPFPYIYQMSPLPTSSNQKLSRDRNQGHDGWLQTLPLGCSPCSCQFHSINPIRRKLYKGIVFISRNKGTQNALYTPCITHHVQGIDSNRGTLVIAGSFTQNSSSPYMKLAIHNDLPSHSTFSNASRLQRPFQPHAATNPIQVILEMKNTALDVVAHQSDVRYSLFAGKWK